MTVEPIKLHAVPQPAESPGAEIARLQAEARAEGEMMVSDLLAAIAMVIAMANAVAAAGDAVKPGVREAADKLSAQIASAGDNIKSLQVRR